MKGVLVEDYFATACRVDYHLLLRTGAHLGRSVFAASTK